MAGGLVADFGTNNKEPVNAQLGGQLAFGVPGPAGGHYTPEVTQPSGNELQFAFVASKADMPDVKPVTVQLPSGTGSGGTSFETDETLTLKDGILSVNTIDQVIEDDVRPVTSGAVYQEFSKAVALLKTI